MKSIRRIIASTVVGLITVGMTLNFSGCSKDVSPLNPVIEETKVNMTEQQNPYGFKILRSKDQSKNLAKEFYAEQRISPAGGIITVGDADHGISSLTFYPNAVSDTVLVSFWWESTGFLEGGSEFQPHGTTFNSAVILRLSYKDASLGAMDEENLKIYYYNEDTEVWEALRSRVDTNAKVVLAKLEHFSRYAVGGE